MQYNLADILTVTHNYLLISVDRLYEVLNNMTGKNLFTHQLPPAAEAMKPVILEKYPDLKNIVVPDNIKTEEDVDNFLATAIPVYGNSFYVPQTSVDDKTLNELLTKFINNGGKVIAVEING